MNKRSRSQWLGRVKLDIPRAHLGIYRKYHCKRTLGRCCGSRKLARKLVQSGHHGRHLAHLVEEARSGAHGQSDLPAHILHSFFKTETGDGGLRSATSFRVCNTPRRINDERDILQKFARKRSEERELKAAATR
jgi:hypothetical protein